MTAIKLPPDPSEIITRAEAKARGLTRYFTGKPCKHGHLAERTTRDGVCQACKPILDRQFFLRHREKRLAAMRKYYAANEDLFRKSRKKWEDLHPEKVRECQRKYNETPRRKAARDRYCQKNRSKLLADGRVRQKKYRCIPEKRAVMLERTKAVYYHGPSNPKGEMQWLRKNLAQLRSVKRYLRNRHREQSESSQPET